MTFHFTVSHQRPEPDTVREPTEGGEEVRDDKDPDRLGGSFENKNEHFDSHHHGPTSFTEMEEKIYLNVC